MRKIVQEEVAKHVCDATGEEMDQLHSCQINFDFDYETSMDGFSLTLDFNDKIAEEILDMLCDKYPNVKKLTEDKKKEIDVQ